MNDASSQPPPLPAPPPPPPKPPQDELVPIRKHVRWGPAEALLGILVVVGMVIAAGLVTFPITGTDGLDATLVGQAILSIALVATAYLFASRQGGEDPFAALGLRKPRSGWAKTAALGYLIYFGSVFVIIAVFGEPEQTDVADRLGFDANTFGAISAAVLIVIVAPICEEIFFRGFFFAGMRSRLPFWPAALISAALFGSVHLGDANLVAALQLAVLGVVLAAVYERTDSLWSNIAIHMFNNAIAFTYLVST